MIKQGLPMFLQYFAEDTGVGDGPSGAQDGQPTTPNENEDAGDASQDSNDTSDDNGNDDGDDSSSDKIVDKLKKRLSTELDNKHDFQDKYNETQKKLDAANKKLEALANGKSIKDLADDDKDNEPDERDQKIAALTKEIERDHTIQQTKDVFTESGLKVPDNVISMVVAERPKQTYSNAKSIIDYISQVKADAKQEARTELLKGKTPRDPVHNQDKPQNIGAEIAKKFSKPTQNVYFKTPYEKQLEALKKGAN